MVTFSASRVQLADGHKFQHLLLAGNNQTNNLLAEELALGGRHGVYIKGLAIGKALLCLVGQASPPVSGAYRPAMRQRTKKCRSAPWQPLTASVDRAGL